jgi:hypothetical protein
MPDSPRLPPTAPLDFLNGTRHQTIEVTTASDAWRKLVPGTRVAVASWKRQATEVSLPGVGTMQTVDSPNFALIPVIVFSCHVPVCLLLFSGYGLVYWEKWRAAMRGIDVDRIAA